MPAGRSASRRAVEAIRAEDLRKRFGSVEAVRGIRFDVRRGEMFGLIGPDGAGKTTTLRLLAGLLRPDGGRALVLGRDACRERATVHRFLGYMPQRFSLYPDLSVVENLRFFAGVFRVPKRKSRVLEEELLRFARLVPFRQRRARDLSGGMKQKLALACTLIHEPEVLVLDEPTTGVDPVSRGEFWEILRRLIDRGSSILVTTPYMDEAARCDRIALVDGGRVLQEGAPDDVARTFRNRLYEVRGVPAYSAYRVLAPTGRFADVVPFGDSLRVTARPSMEAPEIEIAARLREAGYSSARIAVAAPGIEDVFLERTEGEP